MSHCGFRRKVASVAITCVKIIVWYHAWLRRLYEDLRSTFSEFMQPINWLFKHREIGYWGLTSNEHITACSNSYE